MRRRAAPVVLALLLCIAGLAGRGAAERPVVTGIDLVSADALAGPVEQRARAAIGPLVGAPLSRDAVRAGLDRLWGLGLFSSIRVDEIQEAGGVRLSYTLVERPLIRRIDWEGDAGLDLADLAATAGLALNEEASPTRLARAERDLLTRYRRSGYLGARVEIGTSAVPGKSERDVTVVLHAGERARIGIVRIEGDDPLSPGDIAKAIGLREGRHYQESAEREGARAAEERLRRDGHFEARVTVSPPDWHRDTNRVDLVFHVVAGPRYRVEFDGRAALPEAALTSRLTFAASGTTDSFEQAASARQIEQAYRERGYAFARATPHETRDGDVRVIRFAIDEGPQVTVESVEFTGNVAVSSDRLAKEVETKARGLFRRGLFRQDVVEHDAGVVLAYLHAQGYADAAAGPPEVTFSDDRHRARVVIPIVEGPRFTIGAVTIDGAHVVGLRDIDAALPFRSGSPWDASQMEDGRRAIERVYAARGYFGADVQVHTSRRGGAVDVRYAIDEGQQTKIGRVLVRGLVVTREDVVRRTLPFRPGDTLIPDTLLLGQRRLGDFAAFAAVSVDPLRPPPTPFADVDVSVREVKPWRLDFGVGYSNADGVRGFVEVGNDNLFGTGASASLRQRANAGGESNLWGERTDALGRIPFVLGTPWWLDVDIFQEMSGQLGYDLAQYGIWLGAFRELFPERIKGLRGDVRYRLESVRYSDVDPALAASDVTPGRQFISSLASALTLDRRNEPLDPSSGSYHQVSVEVASRVIASDVDFVKSRLETRWFFNWPPPTVIALAGRLGLAAPYRDTVALPIQDRFFAGGATTVRGFREDRLGPLDARGNPTGGNATAILNLEYRFPIWRWFGGAVFVDSGTVTPEIEDLRLDALKTGAGGGLRVKTPVGPIRVDVGYALQPIPGESRTQVYVTVGNPF